jgi:hypothetical protein
LFPKTRGCLFFRLPSIAVLAPSANRGSVHQTKSSSHGIRPDLLPKLLRKIYHPYKERCIVAAGKTQVSALRREFCSGSRGTVLK